MHIKLIVTFVEDSKTDDILESAREAGATRAWRIEIHTAMDKFRHCVRIV